MRRKAVFALATILAVIFLIEPIAQVATVKANFIVYKIDSPKIIVNSPLSPPYVYVKPSFDISFEYQIPFKLPQVDSFSYKLDGKQISPLTISKNTSLFRNYIEYSVFKTIENLPNGNHNLKVYASFQNGTTSPILDTTVTVNTAFIPPIPFMISPLNQTTYANNQVQLTYTINSKVIWSYYSLDKYHASFNGNITLPALSAGSHKLKLFVTTESYNQTTFLESIQTVYFTIDGAKTPDTPSIIQLPTPPIVQLPPIPTFPTINSGTETPKTDSSPSTIFAAMNLIVVLAVVAAVAAVVAAVMVIARRSKQM